jgi:hypothetical protein
MNELVSNQLANRISELLISARKKVLQTVNQTMVLTYFEIGRMIVEEEQNGKQRADYGKHIIKSLSERLTKEFGKGFSQRNLEQIRQFYSVYSKTQTLSAEFNLSWSHYMKFLQ